MILSLSEFCVVGFLSGLNTHRAFGTGKVEHVPTTGQWITDIALPRLRAAFTFPESALKANRPGSAATQASMLSLKDSLGGIAIGDDSVCNDEHNNDSSKPKKTHRGCRGGRKTNKALKRARAQEKYALESASRAAAFAEREEKLFNIEMKEGGIMLGNR